MFFLVCLTDTPLACFFVFFDVFSFNAAGQQATFVQLLQPYILDGRLVALPARVIQALVGHFRQANKLQEVERMILHLNPREMDLDSLVKLCRAHQLHDALIYIFNRGMLDYVTPLEDLLGRPLVREIGKGYTCWWYSLYNFQYRQHYENTCSYNFEC